MRRRQSTRLSSDRSMDAGARTWLAKTAQQNRWRVQRFMDVDDLIQDGYFVWIRCCRVYPDVVDRPHMMALFKRAYTNHLHNLAKKRTREEAELLLCNLPPEMQDTVLSQPKLCCDLSTLLPWLVEAPPAVRNIVERILLDPERARKPSRLLPSHRETTNHRLCRLIGIDPEKYDLHTAILNVLKPSGV